MRLFNASDEGTKAQSSLCIKSANTLALVRALLISKWRQITAHLLQPTYGRDAIPSDDPRQVNIRELVKTLDAVLEPYASSRSSRERAQDLKDLVERGARFGYLLFSQPTGWSFEWKDAWTRTRGEIVVWPALVQTSDEEGRQRIQEVRIKEAQTVAV